MMDESILSSPPAALARALTVLPALERRVRRCGRLLGLARSAATDGDLDGAAQLSRTATAAYEALQMAFDEPTGLLEIAAGEIEYRDGNLVSLRDAA